MIETAIQKITRINVLAVIVASASLITSLATILTIPNGAMRWYNRINWEKNVEVLRVNTNDHTYIYNGNFDPIFVDRMEVVSNEVGKLNYIEIGKTVPGESYLVFMHKGTAYTEMHSGHINSLKVNGTLPETYNMITINKDYPFNKLLGSVTNSKPTYYASDTKIFINMATESHTITISTKSFIVKNAQASTQAIASQADFEQPRILCDFPPKEKITPPNSR